MAVPPGCQRLLVLSWIIPHKPPPGSITGSPRPSVTRVAVSCWLFLKTESLELQIRSYSGFRGLWGGGKATCELSSSRLSPQGHGVIYSEMHGNMNSCKLFMWSLSFFIPFYWNLLFSRLSLFNIKTDWNVMALSSSAIFGCFDYLMFCLLVCPFNNT